jgi:hypothetical protein
VPQNRIIPIIKRDPEMFGCAVSGTPNRANEWSKWYLLALS